MGADHTRQRTQHHRSPLRAGRVRHLALLAACWLATTGHGVARADDPQLVNGGNVATLEMPYVYFGTPGFQPAFVNTLTDALPADGSVPDVDGDRTVVGYCLDVDIVTERGNTYDVVSVASAFDSVVSPASVAMPDGIRWILLNGYTGLDLEAIEARLVAGGLSLRDGLTATEALIGTQMAIWALAEEEFEVGTWPALRDEQLDAIDVANWLLAQAPADYRPTTVTTPFELVEPQQTTVRPGETFGPFRVEYEGVGPIEVAADDPAVSLIDTAGEPVTSVAPSEEFFARVSPDADAGTAVITAEATVTTREAAGVVGVVLPTGQRPQTQAFVRTTESSATLTSVIGWGESTSPTTTPGGSVTTSAPPSSSASTTPSRASSTSPDLPLDPIIPAPSSTAPAGSPVRELPRTGSDTQTITGGLAAVLLALGLGAVLVARRTPQAPR